MEPIIFEKLTRIVRDRAGISLRAGKETLLSARIGRRLRALNLGDAREYLNYLEADGSGEELVQFLDVVSTNYTHFMREREHFTMLRSLAEQWLAQGRDHIRVWCSASSTGEEPYSIALVLREVFAGESADVRILATDISTRALSAASEGVYGEAALEPVAPALVRRYFTRTTEGGATQYRVTEELRKMVVYRRLNLATPPFPMKGPLDAVFCRNVMIYFERDSREGLIGEIERLLGPGGTLFVGHAETLSGIQHGLQRVAPSVYEKPSRATTEPRQRPGAAKDGT